MRVLYLALLGLLCAMPSWAFLTDTAVHPEPARPSLSAAGSKATDPVFGSTILRVTDAGDSSSYCENFYSNMPSLNVNNTKIAAQCQVAVSKRFKVWDFNAATMTRSNGRIQSNPLTGAQEYFPQWSRTTSSKFTVCAQMNLVEVTIPDGTSTVWTNRILHNFATDFPGATRVTQHSVSNNDDVFAVMSNTGGYAVWKRSTNSILLKVTNVTDLDEVEIDKSGRYLVVRRSGGTSVWNLQTGPTQTQVTSTLGFNHRAMGNGIVGSSCNYRRLCVRNLATPNSVTFLLPQDSWAYYTQNDHFAMPSGSDAWMTATRYSPAGGSVHQAFDNEIVQVATDGSARVRRIAHHHSVVLNNEYAPQPKASVSRDGNFITFTSNWGTPGGRRDLYLVRVQSTAPSDTTPPASPSNLKVK
ncbi:MAG: WD40 repeat domain-containing protein [Nitrospira sp.]